MKRKGKREPYLVEIRVLSADAGNVERRLSTNISDDDRAAWLLRTIRWAASEGYAVVITSPATMQAIEKE